LGFVRTHDLLLEECTLTASLELIVAHKVGLHARPAALFVQTASQFSSEITVENLSKNSTPMNGKSILGILASEVMQDHQIRITADGPDEEQALTALQTLIENNFGE
jgi:phosphotransferase system HPr (HPr) family protein